jgi:hypothetical protein
LVAQSVIASYQVQYFTITEGYLVLWEVGKFLEDPYSEDKNLITQVISWRAHLIKVVSLNYVDSLNAIISGSMDGSVR